jgi:cobalt transporter subunit CbtB
MARITLATDTIMQAHIIGSRPATAPQTVPRSDTLAAIFAALLGAFVIWAVGFSHIDVVHNAAHDTRHSAGFPCH